MMKDKKLSNDRGLDMSFIEVKVDGIIGINHIINVIPTTKYIRHPNGYNQCLKFNNTSYGGQVNYTRERQMKIRHKTNSKHDERQCIFDK